MEEIKMKQQLTREKLKILEQRHKSKWQRRTEMPASLLPIICALLAMSEYWFLPNKYNNDKPERYLVMLLIPAVSYLLAWLWSFYRLSHQKKALFQKLCYKAPLYAVIYLLLAVVDYLTLKTGILLQPFIPWVNDILNAAIGDFDNLLISTLFTLRLLFLGYFSGVFVGLITGIACGYSAKMRYWLAPVIQVLGPIPTATWIPLIMILMPSLFGGSIFIVALGTWFSVTVATMTGIANINKAYFDAAKTLGANNRQLVMNVAIPHAMPSIFQGMTQGMSSACISLMIAEMIGVEAGLGWYITWAKAWAAYNKMFAAIIVICLIFNAVTKSLDLVKKYVLRWQTGVVNQ